MSDLAAIILDIEGTTTPISFVHQVLFPYARQHLPALLQETPRTPAISAALAAIDQAAPGINPLTTLMNWMDGDVKATPLKTLQGLVWDIGYADGSLKGLIYPDVAPALQRWNAAGLRLAIYSSGSIAAQKLIFGHSTAGDLTPLLEAYFDTTTGPKRAQSSYAAIAVALEEPPGRLLFLSDVAEELDAAAAAGLKTCQLLRPEDGTQPSGRHASEPDFDGVALRYALP